MVDLHRSSAGVESEHTSDVKLYNSSFYGDMEGVLAALAQGGKVTVRCPSGLTPFLVAAQEGHKDICEVLLAHGSNVNEMVTKTNHTALHLAAGKGHEGAVKALLSWEAAVDPPDNWVTPRDNWVVTPLDLACQNGHMACVLTLLKAGASVTFHANGFSPLLAAAQNGHTDICGILLAHGSDVNEVNPVTKHHALHLAAGEGHVALLEALLSWGAAIDLKDLTGMTPLDGACQEGHMPCFLALLKAGARGVLPIHMAARMNRVNIVKTLLEHEYSPDMVSHPEIHSQK